VLPTAKHVPPKLAQEHIKWRAVLGVMLEARPLEILHHIRLPILKRLGEFFAEWVAKLRQPAIPLPVTQERATHIMAGCREISRPGCACDRRLGGVQAATELAEQNIE
jgi:hypothetical protein